MTYRTNKISHPLECPAELRPLASVGDQVVIAIDPHRPTESVAHLLKKGGVAFTLDITKETIKCRLPPLRGRVLVSTKEVGASKVR